MVSLSEACQNVLGTSLLLALAYLTGCANSSDGKVKNNCLRPSLTDGPHTGLASKNHYLVVGDLEKFQPGRVRNDVLADVQWRGDFIMAAKYKGTGVYLIAYQITSEIPPLNGDSIEGLDHSVMVIAVFVGETFRKFIKWPPDDMEQVAFFGEKWSCPKPIKVGDLTWLARAIDAKPLSSRANLTPQFVVFMVRWGVAGG